jgi:autotransporter passenger strand-loop-strand repeat protein
VSTTIVAGSAVIDSGGVASATLIDGGALVVSSGGAAKGIAITFGPAGGTLELVASTYFKPDLVSVAGWGGPDKIDLRDLSFSSSTRVNFAEASSNTSGTLTVRGRTQMVNILLLGRYSASNFVAVSDNTGGTLIETPSEQNAHNLLMPLTSAHL